PRPPHSFPTQRSADLRFKGSERTVTGGGVPLLSPVASNRGRESGFGPARSRWIRPGEASQALIQSDPEQDEAEACEIGDRRLLKSEEHTSELQSRENL